jgi:hypothetical protein
VIINLFLALLLFFQSSVAPVLGSKLWAGTPSSLVTTGGLSVNVTGNTALVGSMVNSQTGDMAFKTGSLTAVDLVNNDELHVLGGGFQVGFGKSGFTGSVSLDIQDKDREGIVRATIGAGTIEIGAGMTAEKARELLAVLNRDPAKFVEITKDQNDVLKADLDIGALVKLPENIKNIGNLLIALATPVPDDVKDQGEEAEKLFKRLLLSGMSPEVAIQKSETEEFKRFVNTLNFAAEKLENGQKLTAFEQAMLAKGESLFLDPTSGETMVRVPCNTSGVCEIALKAFKGQMSDEKMKEFILSGLKGDLTGDIDKKDITAVKVQFQILLKCSIDEPVVFNQFMKDYATEARMLAINFGINPNSMSNLVVTGLKGDRSALQKLYEEVVPDEVRLAGWALSGGAKVSLSFFNFIEWLDDKNSSDPEKIKKAQEQLDSFSKKIEGFVSLVRDNPDLFKEGLKDEFEQFKERLNRGDVTAMADIGAFLVGAGLIRKVEDTSEFLNGGWKFASNLKRSVDNMRPLHKAAYFSS